MLARPDRRSGFESGGPLHRQRVVTHAERVWIVREADTTLTPDAPRDQCLLCESAMSVRRAWSYPLDWARLPDGELLQLFS
ncbi:MAG: hypothetical protein JWL60_2243 [Gemmatimonadetes bacterium]|jgi:hypothetical protein|nr:hypothetical protein [Gemmatimonadota bacterium]